MPPDRRSLTGEAAMHRLVPRRRGGVVHHVVVEQRERVQHLERRAGVDDTWVVRVAAGGDETPVAERRAEPLAAAEDETADLVGGDAQIGIERRPAFGLRPGEGGEPGLDTRAIESATWRGGAHGRSVSRRGRRRPARCALVRRRCVPGTGGSAPRRGAHDRRARSTSTSGRSSSARIASSSRWASAYPIGAGCSAIGPILDGGGRVVVTAPPYCRACRRPPVCRAGRPACRWAGSSTSGRPSVRVIDHPRCNSRAGRRGAPATRRVETAGFGR